MCPLAGRLVAGCGIRFKGGLDLDTREPLMSHGSGGRLYGRRGHPRVGTRYLRLHPYTARLTMPTESQLRDHDLRVRIRRLIEQGVLPVMVPKQIAGGYGSGDLCVACEKPITGTQVEYEIEDFRNGRSLRFHLGCHVVWQIECARASTTSSNP